jgi:phosphatidylglycerophosphatase C
VKPAIAFFDFDGTITSKDTLFEIVRFQKGTPALYRGLILLAPSLVLFKLKLRSSQQMKEQLLRFFFKDMPVARFQEQCAAFCRERLPGMLRSKAIQTIKSHQAKGNQVVVVTASAQDWVAPWCKEMGIGCIGSALEIKDQQLTGNLDGLNCNGPEKVVRIKEQFEDLSAFREIYAYGDSSGDLPMLALAKHQYFKPFRN